jgi:apolipoprotein N-acyltransferase
VMLNAALLVLASFATVFTNGNYIVPAAAWVAPLLMLRFVRGSRPAVGLPLGALGLVAAYLVAWKGILPFSGLFYVIIVTAVGLIFFTPYLLDRLVGSRIPGLLSTLVFPAAWSAAEYLFARFGGYGSWGAVAYSQYPNLPLLQVVSVTGMWGVTFLIGWFAAAGNWVWENRADLKAAVRGAGLLAAVLTLVLAWGGARLALFAPKAETVRVAGIVIDNMDAFRGLWGPLQRGRTLGPTEVEEARSRTHRLNAALLAQSRHEARQGARIVVWSEGNALVLKDEEEDLIRQGGQLAAEEGIYLFLSMATITPGRPLVENKVVAIGPDGRQLAAPYLKSHPTPTERSIPGDGQMRVADSALGRLAWAICYDYDFPHLIRQGGQRGAAIMLNPSWDSANITPFHTQMSALRAIENGAALFRPANGGLSAAFDHQGRTLAAIDHYKTVGPVQVLIAYLPTEGAGTFYARYGDWLPLASLLLLVLLSGHALRLRAPQPAQAPVQAQ